MFKSLVKNSKFEQNLGFSKEYLDKMKLNTTIAGLCHDIGHGPFSHSFDEVVHKLTADCGE